MEIIPFGEEALLLKFKQVIDPDINQKVHELDQFLKGNIKQGLKYTIPAYCSLTIVYDIRYWTFETLKNCITGFYEGKNKIRSLNNRRLVNIPVCYAPTFALDLPALEDHFSKSREWIIQQHFSTLYRVYMLGFLPGFAFLGKLPTSLQLPRKSNPRLKVPKGSVAFAGLQTGVYPAEVPGGWYIIGRSPLSFFNPLAEQPFILKPGDQVRFKSISEAAYFEIAEEVEKDRFNLESLYE